jgi:hypothetical protein
MTKNLPWWKEQIKLWEYSQWFDEFEPTLKISGLLFYPIWYGCGAVIGISLAIGIARFLGWI